MKLHFSRLWVKVVLWISAVILVIAVPAIYLEYGWDRQMAMEAYVHHLHGAALAVKAPLERERDVASIQAALSSAAGQFHQSEMGLLGHQTPFFRTIQASVVGPDGVILASTEPAWVGRTIQDAVGHREKGLMETLGARKTSAFEVMTHGGVRVVDVSIPLHGDPENTGRVTGALHIAGDYATVETLAQGVARHRLYVTAAVLLGFILALNAVMGRWVVLPIQRLTHAMRMGPDVDVSVTSNDEIGVLGETFNRMAAEIRRETRELAAANRKLSESYEQLLQADKMATLGLMAGTLAHDIANPLTLISGHADLLMVAENLDGQAQESCEKIKGATHKITHLIDGIRNFSRKSAGQWLPVDVHKPIEEALLLVSKALSTGNIRVVKDYAEGPALISGDPNRLEQVFMNLLQNAAQAMEKGGLLTIRTRAVNGQPPGGIEVAITDTGCGIPGEHLDRIFDSFFSTKGEKGTGLGLAICKRIVEEHRGEIKVRSQVGAGTTMCVRLPTIASAKELHAAQKGLREESPV
jgi:signal transduction histidine kinase